MDYSPSGKLWWSLMLRMIGMTILIVAGLNCGSCALFQYNFINELGKPMSTVIYGIIGLVALLLMFDRDYYLSFLGRCATPCSSLLPSSPNDATIEVQVRVPPNVKVQYWAAEPSKETVNNPWDAYAGYTNSGVAVADSNGLAILKVRPPAQYQVGAFKTTLPQHIHYRYCENGGMMSSVYTVILQ